MFYGFVITEGGNALLAKMVAGQTLALSRVVMDKGTAESAEAARLLTAPIDPGPDGTSTVPVLTGATVNMMVEYRSDLNSGLAEGFWIGGFSVYAKDPDGGADVMIYYGSLGNAKQYVSAYAPGTAPDVRRYPVSVTVTAGVEVTLAYPAEAWMNAQDVADYFNGTLKPQLEASLSVLIAAHDNDQDAHGGLRELIQENAEATAAAQKTADDAVTAAATAQRTAEAAGSLAGEAGTAADAAQETADAALSAANAAGSAAGAAQGTATTALETANQAKRDATTALEASENAQIAADAALEAVTKLAHTIDAVPSQNGTLTFTGGVQTPAWNSYNPETLTMGGVTTGTNAGTYTATFAPVEGYTWGDGTDTARSVTWSIGRAPISTVPSQSGTLTYTGGTQSPAWSNYDAAKLTIGGTANGANAGAYTATFTPTANYQWSDGTTAAKSAGWSIGRATVSTVPSQNGDMTYTGNVLTPAWNSYDAAKLTVGGASTATNAGTYTATFTPTGNYQWDDGKTTAKNANWTIGKAAGSLTLDKSGMTLTNGATVGTIAVTRAGDGAITATSSNTGVATVSVSGSTVTVTGVAFGSATITVSVAAGSNHNAPANKTCGATVNLYNATLNANSWAAIRAASDAGQGANYWSVGATKTIAINGKAGATTFSNLSVDVFIAGFNHNASREGSNRIHFQIGKISGVDVGLVDNVYGTSSNAYGTFCMSPNNMNTGGWNASQMRTNVLGSNGTPASPTANTLLACLPADLRSVMKPCTKYSDNTGGGSNTAGYVTSTTDYLPLPAEFEIQGGRSYANSAEQNYQAQYDYYKAGNSRVKYRHDARTTAANMWTRSAYYSNSNTFCLVYTDGSAYYNSASISWALAPLLFV